MSAVAANRPRAMVAAAPAAGVALVALGAAMWGTDGALRAPLVAHWSSWTIVLYEHIILTVLMLGVLLRRRSTLSAIPRREWISILAVSWGGSALATLAFTFAFLYGNPDVVVLLQKSQPLWALAAASVFLGERPRGRLVPLAAMALVGAYLLSFGMADPAHAFTGAQGKAALLALLAAALWGSATALGRRGLRYTAPETLTGLRFACALPVLAIIAATQGALAPSTASSADWLRLVLLALVAGLVGMLLYYRGLRTTPASIATFAEMAFPASALVVNYLVLGATISAAQMVGFAILWAAIVLLHRVPVTTRLAPPVHSPAA